MRIHLLPLITLALWLVPIASAEVVDESLTPETDHSIPQFFDVPTGNAVRTLGIFSRQSKQVAIFPTDMLEGVRTSPVRGDYTPLEALDLMLAGTSLLPSYDPTSGALVVRAAPDRRATVVALPPYVVETSNDTGRWTYAAAPGVEVISRCSDATVTQLLNHHFRLNEMLAVMLPEEFRVQLDVPTAYVLYNEGTQPGVAREMLSEVRKRQSAAGQSISALSNYRFRDRDAVAIFFIIDELTFNQGRISLSPDYVRYMLESRAPSLPAWFIEGMMDVYRTTRLESVDPNVARPGTTMGQQLLEGSFTLQPAIWISEAETQAIKKSPRQAREFLPLNEIFAPLPPALDNPARFALWQAQAALLVRWALQGPAKESRRAALWEFVRRASRGPVDETMFRDCFGLDYAAAEKQLRDYLPIAVKSTLYLRTERLFDLPVVETRDATDGEVSRIKGSLDRMEIAYVRGNLPELTGRYVQQARRTLRKAYDKGDRDPRLLAEMGLCECDAGDDAAARPFLDAAVRYKVQRPRVYYELARIDYEALLARSPEGKFTANEVGSVLRPLATALKQSPQLPEVYELIAEIWLRTEAKLTPTQLAVLDEGIRYFQWRTRLIYCAALLNSLHGRPVEARALIARGLTVSVTPDDRERFLKLQSAIATELAPKKS